MKIYSQKFMISVFTSRATPAVAIGGVVTVVGLLARVRPWNTGQYMSGDIVPFWQTEDFYITDIGLWSDQNGGSVNGYGGMVFLWLMRGIGVALGLNNTVLDGLGYALPPAIGAAGVAQLLSVVGLGGAGAVLAAFYYAFALDWILNTADAAQWARACAPWIGWGVVVLNKRVMHPHSVRLAFGLAAAAVCYASAGSINLPQTLVVVVCALIWLVTRSWYDFVKAADRRQWFLAWLRLWGAFAGFVLGLGGWLLVWNAFVWIFPVLGVGGSSVSAPTAVAQWGWTHGNASFGNLFVGLGSWGWREEYFGLVYRVANSVPARLLLSIPFATAMCAQFIHRSSYVKAVTLCVLIILFVMKGIHEPFAWINIWLHDHLPGMQLLREPVSKLSFLWLLLISILVAISFHSDDYLAISQVLWKKAWFLLVGFSVILCGTLSIRELKDAETSLMANRWVVVPEDWHEVRAFSARTGVQALGRTVVFPVNEFYAVPYVWGSYAAETLPGRFLRVRQVQRVDGYFIANPQSARAAAALYAAIEADEPACEAIGREISSLGVASALLRFDVGSRSARPLGSGNPMVEQSLRASLVLSACGWREAIGTNTLQLLTAPTYGSRPLGDTGDVVVGDWVNMSRSENPRQTWSLPTDPEHRGGPFVATTLPAGYGFALVSCHDDPACGVTSVARAWLSGALTWCEAGQSQAWCVFASSAEGRAHVVRNLWEDLYFSLLGIALFTLLLGGSWAVLPWLPSAPVLRVRGRASGAWHAQRSEGGW